MRFAWMASALPVNTVADVAGDRLAEVTPETSRHLNFLLEVAATL
jgi:hypothetical protein